MYISSSNDKRLFNDKYRVDTTRARWVDYNNGIFVVTICTDNHLPYFAHIEETEKENILHLLPLGKIVNEEIEKISEHYSDTNVLNHIVMPNHVHIMLAISDSNKTTAQPNELNPSKDIKYARARKGRLSSVVGLLKSEITKQAKTMHIPFKWQKGFYDNYVRNQDMLNKFSHYIENNVQQWQRDKHYAKWQ